jgi:hypothetical protein
VSPGAGALRGGAAGHLPGPRLWFAWGPVMGEGGRCLRLGGGGAGACGRRRQAAPPAPGAGARPSRRSPAGTWRLPGRSWMGGAGWRWWRRPSGAVRGRAAVVRPGGRWSTRCFRGWPAGRCWRSRSRPAPPMAPAIGGGDGEPGSASAPARRQLIFGPGSWRELAGGSWSHWNLWFCTVAVPGFDGDWAQGQRRDHAAQPTRPGPVWIGRPSSAIWRTCARTACRRRSGCRLARG